MSSVSSAAGAMEYRTELPSRAGVLRAREHVLYGVAAVTACATPVLVLLGVILIVVGVAAGGATLTAAGLLSGGAAKTLLLLRREAAAELAVIAKSSQDNDCLYQALMLIQQIPELPERAKALRALSGAIVVRSRQG
jgi:hypothetical protein